MTIRFFAAAVEIVGSNLLARPASLRTVGDVRKWLAFEYPIAQALWANCLIAVDQSYASDDHVLLPTEEVAIIPPVSGG
jgi:molybdopterin converting factor subunit 1